MDKIKFGTDGWRGVIGEEFTFENVRRVAAAVAAYVRAEDKLSRGLVIGYDTRFLSAEFARASAEVIASSGIPVVLAGAPTPTPVPSRCGRSAWPLRGDADLRAGSSRDFELRAAFIDERPR